MYATGTLLLLSKVRSLGGLVDWLVSVVCRHLHDWEIGTVSCVCLPVDRFREINSVKAFRLWATFIIFFGVLVRVLSVKTCSDCCHKTPKLAAVDWCVFTWSLLLIWANNSVTECVGLELFSERHLVC